MSLASATSGIPFSNGMEFRAWESAWCRHCAEDHGMHRDQDEPPGCEIHLFFAMPREMPWPECLLPEPDDGKFALPSRMVCTMFRPYEPCGGDELERLREQNVAEVVAYWKATR